MERKILFIINPRSGTKQNENLVSLITRYTEQYRFRYEIYKTTGAGDKKRIRGYLKEFEPETVVVVGGDGTINLVAAALINTKINLGIIPAGSANGLAFNLNLPGRFEEALKINFNGNFKPIDVIEINHQHYCIHLADVGINARIVKRFEKEGSRGLLGYGKQLFIEMFSPKSYFSCTIKTDDLVKKTKAEMVVIANAQSYGTGIRINPESKIDDGTFEVVVIKPYPWWFVLSFPFAGITGRLNKIEYVDVYKTTKASISLNKYQDFQIDGEVVKKTKKIELKIIPGALNVIHG